MTHLRILYAAIVLAIAAPVWANDAAYEKLLSSLASAQSRSEADQLSKDIWAIWLTAPDEAAQEVLDAAMERRAARDFLGAIRHLDVLIASYSDYAEGWNQRATIHYLRGDYEASLADVAETLAREPRHFGAMAGKSVILFNQGKIALAQIAVREALQYHPFLNERAILQSQPETDL